MSRDGPRYSLGQVTILPGKVRAQERDLTCSYLPSATPIEWNEGRAMELSRIFNLGGYPFRKIDLDSVPGIEYRTSYRLFALALDAYRESANPVMPTQKIIELAALPNGLDIIKKIKFKSLLTTIGATPNERPEWWFEIDAYYIKDIGDIFNYNYLPLWKREDPEDYLHGDRPYRIDKDVLHRFRMKIRELISNISVDTIDPEEVLTELSGSYALTTEGRTAPMWAAKTQTKPELSPSIGLVKRCVVPKTDGPRDSIILTPSALSTIKLMELQTHAVIQELPGNGMLDNPVALRRALKRLESYNLFIARDFEKEGITKPREIVETMLSELHRRWPDMPAYQFPDFFNDYAIKLSDGSVFVPKRGHGLGMANALTSLMQIAIFQMILDSDDCEGLSLGGGECLVYNDDYVAAINAQDAEIYWDLEGPILEGLGLLRKNSKSFYTTEVILLCEEYISPERRNLNKKESYRRFELLRALACVNITQAKALTASIAAGNNPYVDVYLGEIVAYWGYEFFRDEAHLTAELGGWMSHRIAGIPTAMRQLEAQWDQRLVKAYWACKQPLVHKVSRNRGRFYPPFRELFGPFLDAPLPEDLKRVFFDLRVDQVDQLFYQSRLHLHEETLQWEKLRKARHIAFSKRYDSTLEEITIDFGKVNRDFLPPDCAILTEVYSQEYLGHLPSIYEGKNPKKEALCAIYEIPHKAEIIPNKYSVLSLNRDDIIDLDHHDIDVLNRKEAWGSHYSGETHKLIYPREEEDEIPFLESYLAPYRVSQAWQLYKVTNRIPILKLEYRNPLINEKKKIFGRLLLTKERLAIEGFLRRWQVRKFIANLDKVGEGLEEVLACLKEIQARREPIEPVEVLFEEPERVEQHPGFKKKDLTLDAYWGWIEQGSPGSIDPFLKGVYDEVFVWYSLDKAAQERSLFSSDRAENSIGLLTWSSYADLIISEALERRNNLRTGALQEEASDSEMEFEDLF